MNEAEQIAMVFEHWRGVMGHERARCDLMRAKVIRARLMDGYTVEDLCLAVDGCAASAWHMGENDRGTVYDSLALILRDADHVDKFIRAGERAHKVIAERQAQKDNEVPLTVPSPEQVGKVREMLRSIKLRRVA